MRNVQYNVCCLDIVQISSAPDLSPETAVSVCLRSCVANLFRLTVAALGLRATRTARQRSCLAVLTGVSSSMCTQMLT